MLRPLTSLKRRLLGRPARGLKTDSPAWYDSAYDKATDYWEPYYKSEYFPIWAVMADRLVTAGARRILDIGCGPGQFAAYLSELGMSVTGIDFSPKAIELARQAAPAAEFHVGDIMDKQWYADPYDAYVCTEVLEHVERDGELIASWTSGVRCLCTVPDFPWESHVRHFESEADVSARYAEFFRSLSTSTFKKAGSVRHPVLQHFLFDGIRA
ncbi:MAG: methyltransferase domain-containing protein [Actinomycetota bacterium]|nr:methyltransferase domain-containing protein [Actinomycetota bacterium]